MSDLAQQEVEQFTDVMVEKLTALPYWGDTPEEIFRQQIMQVIVDTELLVTGRVPLARWLEREETS